MRQDSPARDTASGRDPDFVPPQLELAALRNHPQFPAAMRATASRLVDLHGRGRLIGWFLSDRTLAILAHAAICLDADARDDDANTGLTPGRFKSFCARTGMCGEGRVTAILAFMRLTGHLVAETHPADRRITRLRPTDKMLETMRIRLRAQYEGVAMVCPELASAAGRLGDRDFERELSREFLKRWAIGSRFIDHAPDMRIFLERDVGVLILFALMLETDPSEPLPPAKPIPLSIAALARRFNVSRTHILRLVRDAESEGLMTRLGEKGEQVSFDPRLQDCLRNLFAATFQLSALCAWGPCTEIRDEALITARP
jgi:AraC-like DNA-binding protein